MNLHAVGAAAEQRAEPGKAGLSVELRTAPSGLRDALCERMNHNQNLTLNLGGRTLMKVGDTRQSVVPGAVLLVLLLSVVLALGVIAGCTTSTGSGESDNEVLVRRFFEEVDAGDFESVRELVAPDYRDNLAGRAVPATFDELLEVIEIWHQGFPDLSHSLDEVFSKDDKVVVRGRTRGTHEGEFMGIPPTGRSAELTFICIFRIADGRLAERWPQFDFYNWMEQLRAAPE